MLGAFIDTVSLFANERCQSFFLRLSIKFYLLTSWPYRLKVRGTCLVIILAISHFFATELKEALKDYQR
jgi:hypothetical protein